MTIEWNKLGVNSSSKTKIHQGTIGKQAYPFIIVDNFYQDPAYVRRLALTLEYYRNYRDPTCKLLSLGPFGGKKISRISMDQSPLCNFLHKHWANNFISSLEQMTNSLDSLSIFSMVFETENNFDYDLFSPKAGNAFLKGTVFLNPPEQCKGGLGFYRHKETGLEEYVPFYILGEEVKGKSPIYKEVLQVVTRLGLYENFHDLQKKGVFTKYEDCWNTLTETSSKGNKNMSGDDENWELIHFIEMKYNRLICFPGFTLNVEHYPENGFGKSIESRQVMQEILIPWPKG